MILAAFPRSGYAPLIATGVIETPEPEPEPEPPPEAWVTHPGVYEREGINQLLVDGDRLYIAHGTSWAKGDYNLAWVDLLTDTPVTGPLIPSEGFAVVRKIGSAIYFPWADPMGPWGEPQGYTYSDGAGGWATKLMFPAYHVLDMREHNGDLFACGSGPYEGAEHAQVWRSRDGGDTWERSLVLPGTTLARVYSLLPVGGDLWVFPSSTTDLRPRRLEGDVWVPYDVENLSLVGPMARAFLTSGRVVGGPTAAYGPNGAFNGVDAVAPYDRYDTVSPAWSDATHVYAVETALGAIVRAPHPPLGARSTVTWTTWLQLPEGMGNYTAQTATLHDGHVYVGGTQGRIWRFPAP